VLGQIRGAGTVVVSVSVGSGPETVVAANRSESVRQTEERDATSGGTRITEEHSTTVQPVMARQVTAGDGPVVTRVVAPEVEGVLVVASGASNPAVRAEIFRAVQILFNVAPHRVQVLPMKAGE